MTAPGLLIEYLVSGTITLAWLYPLLAAQLETISTPLLPLFALALYFVGMVIDMLAWAITRPLKHRIRRSVYRKYFGTEATETQSGTLRHAKITLYAPELAKELATRSSRDRIARGSIVSAVLATIFGLPWYHLPWWGGLPIALLTTLLWGNFETLSYMYELCAERVVDEKLQYERNQKGTEHKFGWTR